MPTPDIRVENTRMTKSVQVTSWRRVSNGIFEGEKSVALVFMSVFRERRSRVR